MKTKCQRNSLVIRAHHTLLIRSNRGLGVNIIELQAPLLLSGVFKCRRNIVTHRPDISVPHIHLDCVVLQSALDLRSDLGKIDVHQSFSSAVEKLTLTRFKAIFTVPTPSRLGSTVDERPARSGR